MVLALEARIMLVQIQLPRLTACSSNGRISDSQSENMSSILIQAIINIVFLFKSDRVNFMEHFKWQNAKNPKTKKLTACSNVHI